MKKKNIVFLIVFLIVIVLTILIIIVTQNGGNEVKYNNDKSIVDLVTQKYSDSDIEKIKTGIENNTINYSTFKSKYNIQCLRKTYQGYYAVLLQNNGMRVFVFMDENMDLFNIFVTDEIKSKSEYAFIEAGITTESQVIAFDENTFFLPVSAMNITVHIVQEGVLVIRYRRMDDETGILLDNPIVDSISFYSSSEFPLKNDSVINSNVPYILEIDRY